jgi:ATP-dependent DNA helicase RecQ
VTAPSPISFERDVLDLLASRFGHKGFRQGQDQVVAAALAGRDVLAVMPTGTGKSLTYQLPAVLRPGLTLVISPLIALMRDQVQALRQRGFSAAMLSSHQNQSEISAIVSNIETFSLLYLAPERLRNRDFMARLKDSNVQRLVVDEAHCLSQWGHDFRPDYLTLGELRNQLGNPPVTAVTATATARVQEDIVRVLDLQNPLRLVTGFDRPNLQYEVAVLPGEQAKIVALKHFLTVLPRPGVVYVGTRREAEDVARLAQEWGLRASHYHGAREAKDRESVQAAFMSGRLDIIVATNAFGMGIDKKNVRFVIHYRLPGTLEAYSQEAGRAGRDGQISRCVLLYTPNDRKLQEFFIDSSVPSEHELRRIWGYLHASRELDTKDPDHDVNVVQKRWLTLDQNLQIPSSKLRVIVSNLESQGALERLPAAGGMLKVRLPETVPEFDSDKLQKYREHRVTLLEEMVGFATRHRCRRRLILDYFAERVEWENCGSCDVCAPAPPYPWERAMLEAVSQLDGLAREHLLDVLQGRRVPRGLAFESSLRDWPREELSAFLEILTHKALLRDDPEFPRLSALGVVALAPPALPVGSTTMLFADLALSVLPLAQAGLPPAQVAEQLAVPAANVEKVMLRFLARGDLLLENFVARDTVRRIRQLADELGYAPLAPLRAALGPSVSEFELRAVKAVDEA